MSPVKRQRRTGNVLVTMFVLSSLAARVCVAEEISGDWEMKMDFNGRETFGSLLISKKADGSLGGKWGSAELSDVKLDGQKLTFVRTIKFGDQDRKMTYEGVLKDGILTGTFSGERGTFAANGARRKPRSPALGRWELKYRIRDQDINAVLAISSPAPGGALDARWTSNTGEHVVSDVKFQDGKLSLARKSKIGEREFESTYEGTIQGNKLTGVIKGPMGEVTANGARMGGDLIGKWELTSSGAQGTRTSTLMVFGDLSGRYELFGGEVPIKEIKVEGDQIAFSFEAGFGDQNFKFDFKGRLEGGKTLKGESTSPRGTREVTGKKLDAVSPLVGTWEITRESQQGPRTSTLTIKEDLTGTYTSRDDTVAVTDLRLDGDQLSFKVTVKYGDREVPQEFKGKVDGTALKGTFTTPRGNREATGKKKVTGTSL